MLGVGPKLVLITISVIVSEGVAFYFYTANMV